MISSRTGRLLSEPEQSSLPPSLGELEAKAWLKQELGPVNGQCSKRAIGGIAFR